MKKFLILTMAVCALLCFAACGSSIDDTVQTTLPDNQVTALPEVTTLPDVTEDVTTQTEAVTTVIEETEEATTNEPATEAPVTTTPAPVTTVTTTTEKVEEDIVVDDEEVVLDEEEKDAGIDTDVTIDDFFNDISGGSSDDSNDVEVDE